jgi:hypothetical protein
MSFRKSYDSFSQQAKVLGDSAAKMTEDGITEDNLAGAQELLEKAQNLKENLARLEFLLRSKNPRDDDNPGAAGAAGRVLVEPTKA